MIILSKLADYGVILGVHLAREGDRSGPTNAAALAEATQLPVATVAKVLKRKVDDVPLNTPLAVPPLNANEIDVVVLIMELEDLLAGPASERRSANVAAGRGSPPLLSGEVT